MSLKTDYLDGATGLTQKMQNVFDQGVALVTTNLSALSSGLQTNAAKGLSSFTINIVTTFEPANLRLKGTHMNTYFAGIRAQLAAESIFDYEVSLELNTSDLTTTSIDFKFNF